jgi:hypothetical protein
VILAGGVDIRVGFMESSRGEPRSGARTWTGVTFMERGWRGVKT